ncbi:MAG: hydroxyethylthiazole kinase [Sulfurospirillaceae bacterium]|nr:hydroxyethylthiazole kinase [Sulfurospirillaceae bacterium]MDD2826193.1 hydroxyethylthiazole kinase [Sulfurospirillaceae bacterium]
MDCIEEVNYALAQIKEKRPFVHHITNYVTVNDCANVVLAIGASPVMADEIKEVADMVSICNALVLNIGTCNERTLASMIEAGKMANIKNIPIILDPVGIGATPFRFHAVEQLMQEIRFSVIRGNMAEIKVIAGLNAKRTGVDSLEDESESAKVACTLAKKLGCIIAITGKIDSVSDGEKTYLLDNGHVNLTKVTGTGCMTSSLIGSFLGAGNKALYSAIGGILCMSIAGEVATTCKQFNEEAIGSFKVYLMDAIAAIKPQNITERVKISEY